MTFSVGVQLPADWEKIRLRSAEFDALTPEQMGEIKRRMDAMIEKEVQRINEQVMSGARFNGMMNTSKYPNPNRASSVGPIGEPVRLIDAYG